MSGRCLRLGGIGVALALTIWACGDASDSAPSAAETGADAGADGAGSEAWPAAPALPELRDWDCREGWSPRRVAEGEPWSFTACEPPEQLECEPGFAQFLGEAACQRVGTACPEDGERFLAEADIRALAPGFAGEIVYVDSEHGTSFGGSRENPLDSARIALDRVEDGGIVALSLGEHRDVLSPRLAVAVVGSCVTDTRLVAPSADPFIPTFFVTGLDAVSLEEDTNGLRVDDDATVTVSGALFERNAGVAVLAKPRESGPPPTVTLLDVVIRDTRPGPTGRFGRGIEIQNGARIDAERVLLEDNRDVGIQSGTGIDVERPVFSGTDIVVVDTRPAESGERGWGVAAIGGGHMTLSRAFLRGNHDAASVAGTAPGPILTLEDVVAVDTESSPHDGQGAGLIGMDASEITVHRGYFARNRMAGLITQGTLAGNPTLDLRDVTVVDTRSEPGEAVFGRGLALETGTRATVRRARLVGNRSQGIAVIATGEAPTVISLEDIHIVGTRRAACGELPEGAQGACYLNGQNGGGGSGLMVAGDGEVDVERFAIEGSIAAGLSLSLSVDSHDSGVTSGVPQVTARSGRITQNAIGLHFPEGSIDVSRLSDDVFVFDNQIDFARDILPPPSSGGLVLGEGAE